MAGGFRRAYGRALRSAWQTTQRRRVPAGGSSNSPDPATSPEVFAHRPLWVVSSTPKAGSQSRRRPTGARATHACTRGTAAMRDGNFLLAECSSSANTGKKRTPPRKGNDLLAAEDRHTSGRYSGEDLRHRQGGLLTSLEESRDGSAAWLGGHAQERAYVTRKKTARESTTTSPSRPTTRLTNAIKPTILHKERTGKDIAPNRRLRTVRISNRTPTPFTRETISISNELTPTGTFVENPEFYYEYGHAPTEYMYPYNHIVEELFNDRIETLSRFTIRDNPKTIYMVITSRPVLANSAAIGKSPDNPSRGSELAPTGKALRIIRHTTPIEIWAMGRESITSLNPGTYYIELGQISPTIHK
ncbi:hypothetical protein FQR65_LT19648 [Abscondita terminalis]|nr:hypothetical protein FQR65_LT19648 [Abscondita terminalis]